MNSSDIPDKNLAILKERVRRDLVYYSRVLERLQKIGTDPNDQLFREMTGARNKLQDTFVAIHYAMVSHGVGRAEKPPT